MTNEYRLQGLSCANCAKQFEKNVNQLPGVTEAHVNFGASKIEVDGDVTVEALERAGAFDKIKVRQTLEPVQHVPFYQQKENYPVYISGIIVITAWILSVVWSETHPVVIGLFLLAILIGGFELFKTGLKNLIHLQFDMNTLMTIAIIGASLIGEWREGATVVILFAISEALERYSMDKARASISGLLDIAPKEALVRRDGNEMKLLVDDILIDDILLIKPGDKIAMDGEVIKGYSAVNQAAITGESLPVMKNIGDSVFAGTLNTEGHLEVRVTKHVDDTTLAKMIHLVEDAQKERAASQSFVDQFAKYYTPAIILISILVMIVPPLFLNAPWHDWVYQGLAVLVVGCPCALVISTPVAIVTAIGNAARQGVLIKGGIHLETAGQIQAIAFDKTGTLTKGQPVVTDMVNYIGDEQENLQMMAAMEKLSQHPLAVAVVKKAGSIDKNFIIEDFQSITGKGIEATISGVQYKLGSPKLFDSIPTDVIKEINRLQAEGKTVILFGTHEIRMILAIMDDVRTEASEVIAKLNDMNIKTMMLTGDNRKTAEYIATKMGIRQVESELLPEDKLNIIKSSTAKTAMVGDGVNDAPALAASHVGIAMGGAGTDTALETADIALMRDDLNQLPYLIHLSRKTLKIIKQNITFALGIKLIALLLVIPGWLTLWIAIFADIGATLIVTLNSLRLMKVKNR